MMVKKQFEGCASNGKLENLRGVAKDNTTFASTSKAP